MRKMSYRKVMLVWSINLSCSLRNQTKLLICKNFKKWIFSLYKQRFLILWRQVFLMFSPRSLVISLVSDSSLIIVVYFLESFLCSFFRSGSGIDSLFKLLSDLLFIHVLISSPLLDFKNVLASWEWLIYIY